jgi:hypothetical protein
VVTNVVVVVEHGIRVVVCQWVCSWGNEGYPEGSVCFCDVLFESGRGHHGPWSGIIMTEMRGTEGVTCFLTFGGCKNKNKSHNTRGFLKAGSETIVISGCGKLLCKETKGRRKVQFADRSGQMCSCITAEHSVIYR